MINNDEIKNDESIECDSSNRLNANEIASYLNIDAKSLRSHLRKNANALQCMQSHAHRSSYSFSIDDAHEIIASFKNRSNASNRNHANRSIDAIRSMID